VWGKELAELGEKKCEIWQQEGRGYFGRGGGGGGVAIKKKRLSSEHSWAGAKGKILKGRRKGEKTANIGDDFLRRRNAKRTPDVTLRYSVEENRELGKKGEKRRSKGIGKVLLENRGNRSGKPLSQEERKQNG